MVWFDSIFLVCHLYLGSHPENGWSTRNEMELYFDGGGGGGGSDSLTLTLIDYWMASY